MRRPSRCFVSARPADLNARMAVIHCTRGQQRPSGLVPIALDGKMLRGALRAKATATHLVSVFATVPIGARSTRCRREKQ
ncbi:transposase family protein [Mycobacterium ulcerans str. Harvey]|uniref:Transposase family protein n=1 Tax=Mycobacterium ulcerans str. Harvey TaxID=1299332 RepID=A0ABN0QMC3_MYCUL|nr:transposase family protein [Mycobacterium ulcerans str. Harvey]